MNYTFWFHSMVAPWLGWYFVISVVVALVLAATETAGDWRDEYRGSFVSCFLDSAFEAAGPAIFWLPGLLLIALKGCWWLGHALKRRCQRQTA